MSITRFVGALAMSAAVCAGCQGPEVEQDTDQLNQGIKVWTPSNSSLAFGGMMGQVPIRGIRFSGGTWYVMTTNDADIVPVTSITYKGKPITSLTASEGQLHVSQSAATDLPLTVKTPLLLQIDGGGIRGSLRIYVEETLPQYTAYTAEFSADKGATWAAYCPHEYQNPWDTDETPNFIAEPMIPLGGVKWDATNGNRVSDKAAISLSCRHDAIGGCVSWGYAPWATSDPRGGGTVSLQNYHQACTRLKRADFCGNGRPHTTLNAGIKKHTPIQVWDSAGLYDVGDQTSASMEAYWDEGGATCFNGVARFRTNDPTNSQSLMLSDLHYCEQIPLCTTALPLFMMGSAKPLP